MDFACGPNGRVALARRRGRSGWPLIVVLALSLCLGGPSWSTTTFEAQGRVMSVDLARSAVTLEHGGIPGLLPAPDRSEFSVASGGLLHGVRPGDWVRFTLAAGDESHGLLTVASLTPDAADGSGERILVIAAAILAHLALGTSVAVGLLVWRSLQSLHRRVVALDHETGMLRGGLTDTQDGVRQMARALEDAANTLRVGYVRELRRRLVTPETSAASEARAASGANRALVVVQRGRGELYRAVESGAVGPGCTAIWDRRRGERRSGGRQPASHERRRGERRAAPPESWTRLGFHLVPGGSVEAPRSLRSLRSAGGERSTGR